MSVAKKLDIIKEKLKSEHNCDGACARCTRIYKLIDSMFESKIPVGYWFLTMKQFNGSEDLKSIYYEYVDNIEKKYNSGESICFAGNQGTGKTMSSVCILKEALKRGFSAYYTTASDMLNFLTDYKNSGELRERLRNADFLVIDELDSRFFVSDSVKELFSGIFESIFRFRSHNLLPTIICTNETEGFHRTFYGAAVQSIESLNRQYIKVYPIIGPDFRKRQ